jgi:hypothetical protein
VLLERVHDESQRGARDAQSQPYRPPPHEADGTRTKFRAFENLKAAKALDLTVPQMLLATADEMTE